MQLRNPDTQTNSEEPKSAQHKFQKLAVEHAINAVIITKPTGTIEWVNNAFTELTGYHLEQVVGRKPGDILQGDKTDRETIAQIRDQLAVQESVDVEILNYNINKHPYWVHLKIEPVLDDEGSVVNFIGSQVDITERIDQTESLDASDQLYQELFENTSDAIMSLDEDGLHNCNNATLKLFGFDSYEEFCNKQPSDISPEFQPNGLQSSVAAKARIQEAVQKGSSRFDWVHTRKDGSEFDCEVVLNRQNTKDGPSIQASIRDISERKAAEAALKDEKKAAEHANNVKSEFLANMSHEIRTPLNAILGFTEVLRKGKYSKQEQDDFLQLIHSSGDHLLSLINDILDLSKIEAGKMEFTKENCSLWDIIEEVVSAFRIQAQHKNITLKAIAKTSLPKTFECDAIRLKQLLTNLIGNALKFTEDGGVWINVSWIEPYEQDCGTQAEPSLVIEVRDTGIGITKESMEQLFTPFNQVDNSITRKYGGTGLGLAISNRIAEGFGGKIQIESEIGFGSKFKVLMPTCPFLQCELVEASDLNQPKKREQPKVQTSVCDTDVYSEFCLPKGIHVLLCEDGIANQLLIKQVLKKANVEVTLAENGKEGVDAVDRQKDRYDLILMDMQMPIMDGYTAAKKIRELGYQRSIIALTAHAMRGDRERCLDAGCSDYITKPIEINKFMSSIKNACEPEIHSS